MAANVKYKINGSHDSKPIDQARKGLKDLGEEGLKLNKIFSAVVIGTALKGVVSALKSVNNVTNEMVEIYSSQQKTFAGLAQAVKNNNNLTEKSYRNIINLSGELQSKSLYGDDALQQQATFLAGMGITEDQIGNVLKASVELASTGMMPLDTAVKNISKTLTGTAGTLANQIPAIKDLTTEQLKAGEAISIVQKQFSGMAEAMAGTSEGQRTQIGNIIEDIKKKIGEIFDETKTGFLQKIKPYLVRFDEWLDGFKDKILNTFDELPEVLSILGEMLNNVVNTVFSWEYFYTLISETGKFLHDMLKIAVTGLLPSIGNIFIEVMNRLGYAYYKICKALDLIIFRLMDGFMGIADKFINSIIDGINKATSKLPDFMKVGQISNVDIKTDLPGKHEGTTATFDQWLKDLQQGFKKDDEARDKFEEAIKDGTSRIGEHLGAITKPLLKGNEDLLTKLSNIINKARPDAIKFDDVKAPSGSKPDAPEPPSLFSGLKDMLASLFSGLKDKLASLFSGLKDKLGIETTVFSGLKDKLASLFSGLKDKLASLSSDLKGMLGIETTALAFGDMGTALLGMIGSMKSVQMIFDPLNVIVKAIFNTIAPVIDSLLRPMIGILQIIGETAGAMLIPILQFLIPVVEVVALAFVWLYNNAIKPFANAVIFVTASIHNGIANLMNAILSWVDSLPFVSAGWRMGTMNYNALKLDDIKTSDLDSAGGRAGVGGVSSGGGKSASYSGERDITVNFNFNNSYVNGDARDIAVAMNKEIANAKRLGYI